jgi:hypothetical protein
LALAETAEAFVGCREGLRRDGRSRRGRRRRRRRRRRREKGTGGR